MPIPKEILAVERPKNTRVMAYGKNKDRYAVVQRVGCKNVDGRHIPVDGSVIGHIVNGVYVPKKEDEPVPAIFAGVDLKAWADVILCNNLSQDLLDELRKVYNKQDAVKIYCIAIARVCKRSVKDYELKDYYEESFLSELYPNVDLSKNTVCEFLGNLGKAYSRIAEFMASRTSSVRMDHHLLIDGTLKSDESEVDPFSNFSRKAKTKGLRDISVIYAFDLEEMEPICSKCFPGNMPDATAYEAFLSENRITKGILVGDKGFPSSSIVKYKDQYPDLHYLNPLRRNAKLILRYHMLDFTDGLAGADWVTCRKAKCFDKNKWLYSFRDGRLAAKEEHDWIQRNVKNGKYSLEEFRKKQPEFGTIVLESDLDLSPEVAYQSYQARWEIELVMRYYKHACEFDETRVHDDYSVIGSEFCDFLSSVITYRLINKFTSSGLLKEMTYKQIMAVLKGAKKVRLDHETEWKLIKINPGRVEILEKLDLLSTQEKPPRKKRGRPKKSQQSEPNWES